MTECQRQVQNTKKRRIGKIKFILIKTFFAIMDRRRVPHDMLRQVDQPCAFPHLWKLAKQWRNGKFDAGTLIQFSIDGERHGNTNHPVGVFEKAIITQLMPNVETDQDARSQAGGQSYNIDERMAFVFGQISEGDFEVVLEHVSILAKGTAQRAWRRA